MIARYQGPQIEQLVNGEVYTLQTQNMMGKIYNQETREYRKDNRIMVWIVKSFTEVLYYKVLKSEDDLYNNFEIL